MNRGQATVFIILGLLVVLAVSAFIYIVLLQDTSSEQLSYQNQLQIDQEAIGLYFESCAYREVRAGLRELGQKGGFLGVVPSDYQSGILVPGRLSSDYLSYVWLYKGGVMAPTLAQIEIDLTARLEQQLFYCLNNFNFYKSNQGWSVDNNPSEISVGVTITEESIVVDFSYPLEFSKDENSFRLSEQNVIYRFKMGKILTLRDELYSYVSEMTDNLNTPSNLTAALAELGLTIVDLTNEDLVLQKFLEYLDRKINDFRSLHPEFDDIELIYELEPVNKEDILMRLIDPDATRNDPPIYYDFALNINI